jgi:pimeloyl-ACP methyl ester carboxylesterase
MTSSTYVLDGVRIAAETHDPLTAQPGCPLLVALHGGSYTSRYFAVAGAGAGSFLDVAARNGFQTLTVDRPGYGDSESLPDARSAPSRQRSAPRPARFRAPLRASARVRCLLTQRRGTVA